MILGDRLKPTSDINVFKNYAVNVLRPLNTESGELELNTIGGKSNIIMRSFFIIVSAIQDETKVII